MTPEIAIAILIQTRKVFRKRVETARRANSDNAVEKWQKRVTALSMAIDALNDKKEGLK